MDGASKIANQTASTEYAELRAPPLQHGFEQTGRRKANPNKKITAVKRGASWRATQLPNSIHPAQQLCAGRYKVLTSAAVHTGIACNSYSLLHIICAVRALRKHMHIHMERHVHVYKNIDIDKHIEIDIDISININRGTTITWT